MWKKWGITYLSLLYFDLIYGLFAFDSYLRGSIFNVVLFDLFTSFLVFVVTYCFKEKINKILRYVIYGFLGFWYSLYYIFYKVFQTPFSISLFGQSDQVLAFGKNVILSILANLFIVVLFFAPLILLILLRKKRNRYRFRKKNLIVSFSLCGISLIVFVINIFVQGKEPGNIYNLYFETNNVALNIERLGVVNSTYLDLYRNIFGFEEKIVDVDPVILDDPDDIFDYDYNVLDLELPSGNANINKITKYINKDTGTKQNKYTGIFEGMNLVYIVAESFSEIAVSEELTPTLYKLIHEGFDFTNFYSATNLSTIGGEYQALTGLYADASILSPWRRGTPKFMYGLGNLFKSLGYETHAYHNNSAYFQDRNVYLKNLGFNNFKGCYNGMEKLINCNIWPQSDNDMINSTAKEYVNSEKPFMTYYMTVSGHFYYNRKENAMTRKHWDKVKDLPYSEEVRGFIATHIELDNALETLLKKLEEAGKLDNTVIVLLADHYPYNLSLADINSVSSYKRDSVVEVNSNNLIIYNSKMKPVKVDKVAMSLDALPTVLNLFGVDYDSRLIMGKDILSSTEGIAIFNDKSWVTNKGTYKASSGKFTAKEETPDDYVKSINSIVSNRVSISKNIVANNYYSKVKVK